MRVPVLSGDASREVVAAAFARHRAVYVPDAVSAAAGPAAALSAALERQRD